MIKCEFIVLSAIIILSSSIIAMLPWKYILMGRIDKGSILDVRLVIVEMMLLFVLLIKWQAVIAAQLIDFVWLFIYY